MMQVGNRRSRRLLNDRLLMELVPRLNAEEIRGLFAPPPWGEEVPLSSFCMANVGDWDKVRNTDMDKEANLLKAIRPISQKRNSPIDADKMAVMNAWHRIDCRTREAFRRSYLPELVEGYENRIRSFIGNDNGSEDLLFQVQDPFHRLLLHGVCEVIASLFFSGSLELVCSTSWVSKRYRGKQELGSEDDIIIICKLD
uniref:R3H-associated N-terminal domain-containing protein n=1 Tax=Chenopodium quinoa TaxID=63459 RepID=A0A803N3M8_CHEQI